ncbi:Uracil DNA glycosylase superfamily [Enterobacter hormaechei]|nr:Uracil DNA glycosylase superfamily [Enterobacter hormaechei]
MPTLDAFLTDVRACTRCAPHLPHGVQPVFQFHPSAPILIAGQAPGPGSMPQACPSTTPAARVCAPGWAWTATPSTTLPASPFCPWASVIRAPAKAVTCRYARSAPPAWREAFMQRFERLSLVIVLGSYAMDYHLGTGKTPLTRVVEAWREHWPQAFPLPHPSPRNNRWLVRNPWFQQDVLPALQARVQAVLTANPKETP